MRGKWFAGNDIRLLENGEEFFARVFECISAARTEVVIETFILFEDKVGRQLHQALVDAGRRGVQVDITIDGYGSPDLSPDFIRSLEEAGVRLHVFEPGMTLLGQRVSLLRRMHRKIAVIDNAIAFVGGINYSADHLGDFGPEAKQDYAVEIHGPLVAEIHRFTHAALVAGQRHNTGEKRRWWSRRKAAQTEPQERPAEGSATAMLVSRDNHKHTNDIERFYRIAIRAARERVVIANAYFFPGYRLIKELRRAAKRGVDVHLILQGEPDMPIVKLAARTLYRHLVKAGVHVHEYTDRPLHGKVALADHEWATVGSSNLDPLSLTLNLEANVVIRDRAFNEELFGRLDKLMCESCKKIAFDEVKNPAALQLLLSYVAFHLIRRYPRWASWLPRHMPRLYRARPDHFSSAASGPTKEGP